MPDVEPGKLLLQLNYCIYNDNFYMVHEFCSLYPTEVFSKPQLYLEPVDLFEGEQFRLNCSVKVFFPEMIGKPLKYHLYKDGTELTSSTTHIAVAHPNCNGNYSCKVEGNRISTSFHKESEAVIVKAKGKSSDVCSFNQFSDSHILTAFTRDQSADQSPLDAPNYWQI